MSHKNKKKDKRGSPKIKINIQEGMKRPKPISIQGSSYFVKHAREYPIFGCWLMQGWKDEGLTPVLIARKQAEDKVIFASYLVDFLCLGVKDALSNGDFPLKRFMDKLEDLCQGEPEPCDVDFAHEMVYGAIEYARRYGFEPHPDFQKAAQVLDPPDIHPARHDIEFGKNGMPLFIPGPYDNGEAIIARLRRTAGEGNYSAMLVYDDDEDDYDDDDNYIDDDQEDFEDDLK